MGMGLSGRLRQVRPWPGGEDMGATDGWSVEAYGPRSPGLREMHLKSVAAAFESADRIARDAEQRFEALALVSRNLREMPEYRGMPVPSGTMDMLRSLAAEASVATSLLSPPKGHHWGIEMPDAMNASIGDPASMLRKMGCDPGRSGEECDALEHAAEAVPVALRMATSMAQVFAALTSEGISMASHFLDDDDNDGEYLRQAARTWQERYL